MSHMPMRMVNNVATAYVTPAYEDDKKRNYF